MANVEVPEKTGEQARTWRQWWIFRRRFFDNLLAMLLSLFVFLALRDVVLAGPDVTCAIYQSPLNHWLRDAMGILLPVVVAAVFAHAFKAVVVRRLVLLLIDAAALVILGGVLWYALDRTLLHCFLYGAQLPPCLFGCAH